MNKKRIQTIAIQVFLDRLKIEIKEVEEGLTEIRVMILNHMVTQPWGEFSRGRAVGVTVPTNSEENCFRMVVRRMVSSLIDQTVEAAQSSKEENT